MTFQPGHTINNGIRRGTPFRDALLIELTELDGDRSKLRRVAERLVKEAIAGNAIAIKEIGDRVDGKAAQITVIAGDQDGGPVQVAHTLSIEGLSPDARLGLRSALLELKAKPVATDLPALASPQESQAKPDVSEG